MRYSLLLVNYVLFTVLLWSNAARADPEEGAVPAADEPTSDDTAVTEANSETPSPSPATIANGSSSLLGLSLSVSRPGLGKERLTTTVFQNGHLVKNFSSCSAANTSPDSADLKFSNVTGCYTDSIYTDRIMFDFSFNRDGLEKQLRDHKPELQFSGDFAEPTIAETIFKPSLSTGKVSILYNCKPDAEASLGLRLTLSFGAGPSETLHVYWVKECKGQDNDELQFGHVVPHGEKGRDTRTPFATEDVPLIVAPSDVSTEIFFKLDVTGAQQAFLAPMIVSSDPDVVTVAVRGNHPEGGILSGLEVTTFQVMYECLKPTGSSEISISVGIPPFNNLTASYKKECGGAESSAIIVGTTDGGFDVVDRGHATPRFTLGVGNIGTEHSEQHFHLPGNTSSWTVYLSYNSTSPAIHQSTDAVLHSGRLALTIESPDTVVANVALSKKGTLRWAPVDNVGVALGQGDVLRMDFNFYCRRVGESRILVTVPLLQYDSLEFGLAKECTHAASAKRSGGLFLTAGTSFTGVLAIALLACCFVVYRARQRQASKHSFEPLPTSANG